MKDLTPGEIRSLKRYCEYEYHGPAAASLSVSTQTLKNHLGAVYKKVGRKKAHSALYALCLSQGYDPFEVASTTPKVYGSVVVNSESTTLPAEIVGKYRESPASDPILTQTAGNDIIPNELSNTIVEDSVPDTSNLPPILERDSA